jgi:hypothetical protein
MYVLVTSEPNVVNSTTVRMPSPSDTTAGAEEVLAVDTVWKRR